jgi:DNA-directed RNA polymerase subunit M/transcription elongation factor TFIIS
MARGLQRKQQQLEEPRSDPRCPHCTERDAQVISLFGTQAMTLQYRCRRCGTLFEAIKFEE